MPELRAWWTAAPSWVKAFGLLALLLALLFVVLTVTGHNPRGHGP